MTMRLGLLAVGLVFVAACGERRDTAEVAAGLAPFDELRGIPFNVLRSGGVRALRKNVAPVMGVGLRETIGAYDVSYAVPVFDSTSGDWPVEDALVLEIGAARSWSSDSAARVEWGRALDAVTSVTKSVPRCVTSAAAAADPAAVHVAEFERGDTLYLTIEFIASALALDSSAVPAQTLFAIRRNSLAAPAWAEAPCPRR
jgi:hypothetical protein